MKNITFKTGSHREDPKILKKILKMAKDTCEYNYNNNYNYIDYENKLDFLDDIVSYAANMAIDYAWRSNMRDFEALMELFNFTSYDEAFDTLETIVGLRILHANA